MKIELEKLMLSDNNPRLSRSFSEQESIANMIIDQKGRLVVLAESIVNDGLNPLGRIGVYPSKEYDGYYIVGEGNRRICALKLLVNPDLSKDVDESIFRKFSQLKEKYQAINEIEVELFNDYQSMRVWIENIHMGEQGGKGVVKWDSVQKQRFDKDNNGKNLILDFFDCIISNHVLSSEEIKQVTLTNWQRILRKKYYKFLCIETINDKCVVDSNRISAFTERIHEIHKNLAGKTVSVVYDNEKIDIFFNDICYGLYQCNLEELLARENNNDVAKDPDISLFDDNPEIIDLNEDNDNDTANQEHKQDDINNNNTSNKRDLFTNRKTIIPYALNLKSSSPKINKVINELKRLPVDIYPHACAALLRILFELSSKHYIESKGGDDQTKSHFEEVIRCAANLLRSEGKINNNAHSRLMNDVDIMRKMFNDDMHAVNSFPSIEGLKAFFTSHHHFIEECLKV